MDRRHRSWLALLSAALRRARAHLRALWIALRPATHTPPHAESGCLPPAAPVADDPWVTAEGRPRHRLTPWE